MKFPNFESSLLELDTADSTQALVEKQLATGEAHKSIILAHHQTAGRGRFDRKWISDRDLSLTMSLVFSEYADHQSPWLIGMSVAAAAAGALHCQLQWPNDLVVQGRKLGGILTEMLPDNQGRRIPVVGVGINLNQTCFPFEVASFATSLRLVHGDAAEWGSADQPASPDFPFAPREIAKRIVHRIATMPEPNSWQDLEPIWMLFDATEGKRYKLQDGRIAVAIGFGPNGRLHATCEGEPVAVLAADALFGA